MRFTVLLVLLVLLPVMMAAHLWDYVEHHELRLMAQAEAILKKHDVRGGTVNVRYLDLSVTGDAQDEESLQKAVAELATLGPLRLVDDRLAILARLHVKLEADQLTLDGWVPDEDTADALKGLLLKVRPDLQVISDELKVSRFVRWPEGEKLPLSEQSPMLKPIIGALHVPPSLEISRREGKLIAAGMVPTQELKENIQQALNQPLHGLGVDVSQLRVSSHVLEAPFVSGEGIVPFLRSFYATPSPGEFSIRPGENPQLKADTTRTLESAWLGHLRAVTKGTRVEMQLTQHPSVYHFPGRRIETPLSEDVLQSVRDLINGELILFTSGSSSLAPEERARLAALVPALLSAGPVLRLIVGGHPELGRDMKSEQPLALQRAEQVASYLIEQGAPSAEIRAMAFDPVTTGGKYAPLQTPSVEILIQ
ncbi:MAG: OmpA family [Verrucomicrobiota bacterium]|jgi:outer membrane protein OmpA-like peptidoglycan-associated protein